MAVLALILVGAVVLVLVIAIVVMQMRRARMQAGAKKGGGPKDDEDVVVLGAARPWRKHVHSRRGYRGRFPDRRVVLMSGKQERRLSRKVGSALSAGYEYDMAQDAVMSDMAHIRCARARTHPPPFSPLLQAIMAKMAKSRTGASSALNNVLMQMRKVANHPDLLTSQYDDSLE